MIYHWGCKPGSRSLATGHGSWIFNGSIFQKIRFYSSFFAPFFLATHGNTCGKTNFIGSVTCWLSSFIEGPVSSSIARCSANRFAGSLRFCPVSRSAFCCDAGATLGRIIHTRHRNPMGYVSFASLFQGSSAAFGYVDTPAGTPNIFYPPPKKIWKSQTTNSWRFEVQYHENLWVRTWSLPAMVDGKIADWNRICCHLLQ